MKSLPIFPILLFCSFYQLISCEVESIVTPQWLIDNFQKVKIIEATFGQDADYLNSHISGAGQFKLDTSYFQSEFIKCDLYPPEIFQKILRLQGINNGDHVVIYSRGLASGMKFASRAYWTFKAYGITNVSVLNGGFDSWKSAGGPSDNNPVFPPLGNIQLFYFDNSIWAKFEEIPFNNFSQKTIFLDARISEQFTGQQPLTQEFPGTVATGSHVSGSVNFPMLEVIGPNGFLSKDEINAKISQLGIPPGSLVYTSCNTGYQSSVIFLALERSGVRVKNYNGSMHELAYRAPQLVNSTGGI